MKVPKFALDSSDEEPPIDDEPDFGPCRLCGRSIEAGQWITSDGVHHHCAEQYPDAMFG